MAERSNGLVIEQYQIAPNTTRGVTGTFGQYAVGVQVTGGTAALTNIGGSFGNGFLLPTTTLGLNCAGTFYIAASGSTAVIQIVKTVFGVSMGF
jgi:hypothetical protein